MRRGVGEACGNGELLDMKVLDRGVETGCGIVISEAERLLNMKHEIY